MMVGGFLALAMGIVSDGYHSFKKRVILFMAVRLPMRVAGAFCHTSFDYHADLSMF
jgi:hypothetical protein